MVIRVDDTKCDVAQERLLIISRQQLSSLVNRKGGGRKKDIQGFGDYEKSLLISSHRFYYHNLC